MHTHTWFNCLTYSDFVFSGVVFGFMAAADVCLKLASPD